VMFLNVTQLFASDWSVSAAQDRLTSKKHGHSNIIIQIWLQMN